jgi:lycopene cyclase domain-containing protein
MKSEYCIVLAAVLLFPLALSFDRKLEIYAHARSLAKTMAAVAIPFWIWDTIATTRGHWWFNNSYVLGLNLLGLPIEEWLFFLVVPFVSIFTWESTKYFMREKK